MNKKFAVGMIALSSIAVLTACNDETPKEEVLLDDDKVTEKETQKKESVLKDFAYSNTEPEVFNGVVDYGHELYVENVKEEGDKTVVTSVLTLDDLSGQQAKEDLTYKITQTISDNQVVESIEGDATEFMSIIPDKVVLQTPLKVDNKWTQDVTLEDGKAIQAETVIEKVEINEAGKQVITTKTTFVGGEVLDYPKDSYYERATYEEGKGLISFERPASPDIADYIFSYELYEDTVQ